MPSSRQPSTSLCSRGLLSRSAFCDAAGPRRPRLGHAVAASVAANQSPLWVAPPQQKIRLGSSPPSSARASAAARRFQAYAAPHRTAHHSTHSLHTPRDLLLSYHHTPLLLLTPRPASRPTSHAPRALLALTVNPIEYSPSSIRKRERVRAAARRRAVSRRLQVSRCVSCA